MPDPRESNITLSAVPVPRHATFGVQEAPLAQMTTYGATKVRKSGESIEHRLRRHLEVFAFELVSCAMVGRHCFVVLRETRKRPVDWTAREVAERWLLLFYPPPLIRRYLRGERLTLMELQTVLWVTSSWRRKLTDEGYLLRSLNKGSPVRVVRVLNA